MDKHPQVRLGTTRTPRKPPETEAQIPETEAQMRRRLFGALGAVLDEQVSTFYFARSSLT